MIKFPQNFLWGAATSSYQVEGDNVHADWAPWEEKAGKQRCGAACRHYEFYERDFDLAKELHHNAHRLSIEWSRIEPEEGRFSQEQLKHYLDVILALRARHIEPIVTLHHFTNPIWFAESGGWTKASSIQRFLRYSDVVTRALAKHVHYWITINEPNVYLSHAYMFGVWPPQERSNLRALSVAEHMVGAHILAYRRIHKVYEELNEARPAVGIAQNVMAFVPFDRSFKNRFAASLRDWVYNRALLSRVMRHSVWGCKNMDFIGVNYYSRQLVELKKIGIGNLAYDVSEKPRDCEKNSLGWDIYPEGLYDVLMELKDYRLPLMITENGVCTSDDAQRWKYIVSHLESIHRAMEKGVPVIGYLYWSLMDNFEWDKGFSPRFGLIGIDYATFTRNVRESARLFGEVCKTGELK